LSTGEIDIPWFVSRGYVVCAPDIVYKTGETGLSAVRSVVGAARYLAKNHNWADSTRFGLNGHSFGGYETNFIVTQSNLFAAAVSSAGIANVISNYGQLWGTGNSMSEYWEYRDGGIGKSLPEAPELYLQNSPIRYVANISTPLLIQHNKEDDAVPFGQGVELFTSLRRIGKKVWLLQYDKEGHSILNEKNTLDYTIRVEQFFDHYLKGTPAPKWMTRGVPASMKGIDSGLELDLSGAKP
jgi:dipeptidyl aminopeptidase/acylaminoacyl peptidase